MLYPGSVVPLAMFLSQEPPEMLTVAGGMASHSKTFLDSTEVSFRQFREPKGSDILELLLFFV